MKNNHISLLNVTWLCINLFFDHRKLRQKLAPKLLLCLVLSLILLLFALLIGIDANNMKISYGCQVFAGLLQYLMLSTFSWMAIEAVNLYRSFVKVFKSSTDERFFKFALCFAWGKEIS